LSGRFFRLRRNAGGKSFLRWFCYVIIMLFLFMLMSGGFFKRWQPILIIPLAIAVSMREREFGGSIFGVCCGFMIDSACGNLFGMSSVWLMPCCLAASLLIMNLIRPNFINHIWLVALTCLIMAFMDYFFKYVIWNRPNSDIMLKVYIIPSYFSAVLLSPVIYFLVKAVSVRFGEKDTGEFTDIAEENDDE